MTTTILKRVGGIILYNSHVAGSVPRSIGLLRCFAHLVAVRAMEKSLGGSHKTGRKLTSSVDGRKASLGLTGRRGTIMAVHRFLISFVALIACCSPTLADTINSFRRAHGLPVLHQSGKLQAMAARHASSMAARGSMDHDGFYSQRGPAGARAENVAFGCPTESCAVGMWEGSAGHRTNMLLKDVRSYGLASAAGGGTRYWCLILGR